MRLLPSLPHDLRKQSGVVKSWTCDISSTRIQIPALRLHIYTYKDSNPGDVSLRGFKDEMWLDACMLRVGAQCIPVAEVTGRYGEAEHVEFIASGGGSHRMWVGTS